MIGKFDNNRIHNNIEDFNPSHIIFILPVHIFKLHNCVLQCQVTLYTAKWQQQDAALGDRWFLCIFGNADLTLICQAFHIKM